MLRHPLFQTLKEIEGNQKACTLTEPLWGIPFQLFAPFASLYMSELGVTDAQIGITLSVGMAVQIIASVISGPITDKFGRKRTTFIFDLLTWSLPCLVWMLAKDFTWFIIAAVLNALNRVAGVSWTCMLIEDAQQKHLVNIYAWVFIFSVISGFVSPLAVLFVSNWGLITTVRYIYLFAFIMMTLKFILLNIYGIESSKGKQRMLETYKTGLLSLMRGYGGILRNMLNNRKILYTLAIMAIFNAVTMINGSYWPLLVTGRIGLPQSMVAIFPFIRSIVLLLGYFFIVPKFKIENYGISLETGFIILILSQAILFIVPINGYVLLIISIILESVALSVIQPMLNSLVAISVGYDEMARILSIFNAALIAISAPFGWIAGQLSETNRIYPFILNISMLALGMLMVALRWRSNKQAGAL